MQRERQAVVEAAAVAEGVRLVDQHADDVELGRELAGALRMLGVDADRVAAALVVEDRPQIAAWPRRNRGAR